MSDALGLQVRELEIGFHQPIREPFTFDVPNGQVTVVLGPNGSGKTTLLRTLAGLLPACGGAAYLNGIRIQFRADMDVTPAPEGVISLAFQDHRLVPILTGMENVLLGVPADEMESAQAFAAHLASELDATELLDRVPLRLSYGEQQKISLLRSLVRHCSALLMDEPTASLHERGKTQVANSLRFWTAERQVPVLIVTHDWPWARGLADRFVILDGSKNHVANSAIEAVSILLPPDVAEAQSKDS